MQLFEPLTSQAHLPSPPFSNVHGLTATGKSSILRAYFRFAQLPYAFINVRECITTRHLLERIVAASLDALEEAHDEKIDRRPYARTENLSALCVNLQKMLEGRGKFVLVLDAIDKLREGGGTLIAALGRLGEAVRLTLLLWNAHANWITRYQTSPSSLQRRFRSHRPSATRLRYHTSPFRRTHASNSSPSSLKLHQKSSSHPLLRRPLLRRPLLRRSFQTIRPTSPPRTTLGFGPASSAPYTIA